MIIQTSTIENNSCEEHRCKEEPITLWQQLAFFIPLAMTSLMITTTHSLFNAGLARLSSPEIYISAFAVAKSLMHLIQSPVVMTRQTVTALINDQESYYRVRKFIIGLVAVVVSVLVMVAFTGIGRWIFRQVMGLEGRVLEESVTILKILVLFPAAVTLRSFNQGIAIKLGMTPLVTVATLVRIIFVSLVVLFIGQLTMIPGAVIAGMMFLGAVTVEAIVAYTGTRLLIRNIPLGLERQKQERPNVEYKEVTRRLIFSFFSPLVITAFMRTLSKPMINIGLARTSRPEIAISVYAVAWGLGMIFISPLMMFHQVPIQFMDDDDPARRRAVRRFAVGLGVGLAMVMVLISFTNLGYIMLRNWIGASEEISLLSMDLLKMMVILPVVIVAREFYWGILMKRHLTKYISQGKTMNLIGLAIGITCMTILNPANSAMIGIGGMIVGQTAEFCYLYWASRSKMAMGR